MALGLYHEKGEDTVSQVLFKDLIDGRENHSVFLRGKKPVNFCLSHHSAALKRHTVSIENC